MDKKQGINKRLYIFSGIGFLVLVAALFVVFSTSSSVPVPAPDPAVPEQDIAGFYRDCVETVLKTETVPESCATVTAIKAAYSVEMRHELERQQGKMIMTARRIARGDILDKKAYKACLKSGECVKVPLFPDTENAEEPSPEEIKQRQSFWHLVNDGAMTPALCLHMDVCRAMAKIGLVGGLGNGSE